MTRLAAFNPAVRTLDESIARAKAAEKLGYESVWTTQMPDARDAALVLAAYAHATARSACSAPHRADLPIMISALNPRMLELAGEIADGVVLWMCTPAYVRDVVVPTIARGRQKVGRSMDGFEVVSAVPVCLTTDRAAANEVFRKTVARYAGLPYYRKMMDASGLKDELDAEKVGERVLDELAGIGDGERVRDAVRRYREAGVTLPGVGPFAGHEGAKGFEATLEAAAS